MASVTIGSGGPRVGMQISPQGMGALILVGMLIGAGILFMVFKKKITGKAATSSTRLGLSYNTSNDLLLTLFQDIQGLIDLVKPYGCAQVESMKVEISNTIDKLDDRVCTGLTQTLDELSKEVSKKEGYREGFTNDFGARKATKLDRVEDEDEELRAISAEGGERISVASGSFGPQMIGFNLIPKELMNTALPMMSNIVNKLNPQICPGGKLNKAVLKKLYVDMLDSICG